MRLKTGHPTSFTSCHIFKDRYDEFKQLSIPKGMTLQKLINRCVYLYAKDEEFRKKINQTNDLQTSGSAF
jgi:hypothetical protein